MPYVQLGNFYYFLYFILAALAILGTIIHLKSKTDGYRYWFLFSLLALSFVIHFVKILFSPYADLDFPARKLSLETICAINVVAFPFLYMSKSKTLKDYMVMAGMVSGLISYAYPANALNLHFDGEWLGFQQGAFSFEVVRFYLQHAILFLVPFVMMHYKMHELSIKRVYRAPLLLVGVFFILYINELLITWFGWAPKEDLYQPDKRNPSMVFGVREELIGAAWIMMMWVPAFMTVHPVTGDPFFWPVIWMILPVLIYTNLMALGFGYAYDRKNTHALIKKWLFPGKREQPDSP